MAKRKEIETRGLDTQTISVILSKLPEALARLVEERNRERLNALKGSSGVILAEIKKAGQNAAELIADVLGIEAEFSAARSLDDAGRARLRELVGLVDVTEQADLPDDPFAGVDPV